MKDLWHMDEIQFPRLIAEINAVGLDSTQWNLLCQEMDLASEDLSELFDRAHVAWEDAKEKYS